MPQALLPFDLLPVFNAQPGATLLLSPEWVVVAVSDDYLAAAQTQRDIIVGQFIFDAFPDNPDTPDANAVANVRASLAQVMATRQPHDMAPQHYDVPDQSRPGRFLERYWKPRHTPVFDDAGQVRFIIQSVQDITASWRAEQGLRESQAREQVAQAEAETQRQRLYNVLMQLPAQVAVYHGPDHVYQFVSPNYQRMFPHRSFLGRPFREGMPEAEGLGVVALFDQVYQTGEPYYGHEMEGWFDFAGNGRPEQLFFELSLHPLHNVRGEIDGVLDFSYDVTEQVRARQQVQQLNDELEARVQQRTAELEAVRAEVEEQRNRLLRLFGQAPAHINLFSGPNLVWTLVHPASQRVMPHRPFLGLPRRQALPELPDAQHALFERVYRTGEAAYAPEESRRLDLHGNGEMHEEFFDMTVQPTYDAAG
ncbi:PAS domain-containing protein [Hymenobacter sp. ISL-91]|uniref:PAS domain-containing protein n=1 Tax=Hymenobacter sp. ISL-91 TaxID=2819151 RepID=UPI001BE804D7|nr:PAS domain-containing protein [Hymenobacter sp. ISL-91]MBT2558037.1 PAS domain-containing protein [Hymenobacter sp. ISL-91]